MAWSEATERLRARYYALYGLSQGIWVSSVVVWLGSIALPDVPGAGIVALFVVGVAMSAAWRWSWRKFRAAFRAETDKVVAEAREELRLLDERLRGRLN